MWSDCLGAISCYHHGLEWSVQGCREAASVWRSIGQRHKDLNSVVASLLHVKAHRPEEEARSAEDLVCIKGNKLADEYEALALRCVA